MNAPAPRPYTLVAELTYRCPLRCAYCSNPVDLAAHAAELTTDEWRTVLTDAEALGVMAVHFTGGEPLLRRDLEALVSHARALGLYTNLITSGVPLGRARLDALASAGLDHVQLSVQDTTDEGTLRVAGVAALDAKREVASWVKARRLPLTLNVVLHALNVDRAADFVELALALGADRLELAHTQYLGWALENRAALLPTRDQIAAARDVAKGAQERHKGVLEIVSVLPDYVAGRPRGCMDGWARRFVVVSPDGLALPCHAAHTIEGLAFESVRERPLGALWRDGGGMRRFRGEGWMQEPCRTCDRRALDFGGCRCQAFHLTGDASRTDPACSVAPDHAVVARAVEAAGAERPRRLTLRGPGRRRLPFA